MPDRAPVLLVTSNGVGMGHLTRQLAVAASAPRDLEPVLLSLSGALPTVASAVARGALPELGGLRTEYCPSRRSGWLPHRGPAAALRRRYPPYQWEPYFRDRLRALVAETGARAVVFDGVVPYRGLREARAELATTPFVWMRRGMWREGVGADWLRHAGLFDLVLEPGDIASERDRGLTRGRDDARRVAPISIASALHLHDRSQAREALGLDPDRPALLLTPGTGVLEDVASPVRAALATVRRHQPEWQVVVTSPVLARHGLGDEADVVLLRDTYPLARSLAAFDAAVSAAGYNSVHELLGARVPTLLVPGLALGADDQVGRAEGAADLGAALVARPDDPAALEGGVTQLLEEGARRSLSRVCAGLPEHRGAAQAASAVAALAVGAPSPAGLGEGPPLGPPRWRAALPDLRTPVVVPGARPRDGAPVLHLTEDLPDRLGDEPVEHLVHGSSAGYRRARARVAGWVYRA
ncbi:hypothetical protein AWH69_00805 [Janibacter melonis]|uniref:Glycosyl transferase family 28 C-terminal domain-containing protein n=1 Tax=Janibacter melonis TaxID=262209 RepID=A0A176QF12_9MICO|nr:hypothetical protein [Janibacter melonis]OAB88387.1 hypothetical protein AWH69_00805 [Janibacter melonis]